jgi:Zn-finger protein
MYKMKNIKEIYTINLETKTIFYHPSYLDFEYNFIWYCENCKIIKTPNQYNLMRMQIKEIFKDLSYLSNSHKFYTQELTIRGF